ncbi:DNA adenine methylase [Rahnella sp. PAMC25617]|uniref:DNA adenine methylase n=1 Tax=Rahnella sp. PAMC25617 TaxID=3399684 RepID=UPI003D364CC5
MKVVPHVIPYQGSKRKLANDILENIKGFKIDTFYEPFAGSAAVTLAAAARQSANKYIIGDKYTQLMELWGLIINSPADVSIRYSKLWHEQLEEPNEYFLKVRSDFNKDNDPVKLLYLMARCVKNAIRFNNSGEFNQSQDKRRLGTKPEKIHQNLLMVSNLLKDQVELFSGDFRLLTQQATTNDLVYMDPPWQGTSTKKDPRYAYILDLNSLIDEMENMNIKGVPYILSFDGVCGDKSYGNELPDSLQLKKIMLSAGRSSQATLLGRDDSTFESLYLSPALLKKMS